jgi:hypothetical protein
MAATPVRMIIKQPLITVVPDFRDAGSVTRRWRRLLEVFGRTGLRIRKTEIVVTRGHAMGSGNLGGIILIVSQPGEGFLAVLSEG